MWQNKLTCVAPHLELKRAKDIDLTKLCLSVTPIFYSRIVTVEGNIFYFDHQPLL